MKRCVIVGAAEIRNYEKIRTFLKKDDFFIFCDGGLNHQEKLGVTPNLIIGDFDSYDFSSIDDTTADVIRLPREKDDTDVFFAVKTAHAKGYRDFLFLGVIGQRFDHSLCNISVLLYLKENAAVGTILDDYSEMQIVGNSETPVFIENYYSYFSIMCVAGDVSGVTIRNAKYPLENGEIKSSYQFGISNEGLPSGPAEIIIKNGQVLLIKVW